MVFFYLNKDMWKSHSFVQTANLLSFSLLWYLGVHHFFGARCLLRTYYDQVYNNVLDKQDVELTALIQQKSYKLLGLSNKKLFSAFPTHKKFENSMTLQHLERALDWPWMV